ncbi:MAG: winged helix-turn-helix transcriptional regulator [Betaproteobacteria bacterium]|nr:winged helix-turn-helix transcriptional regulator [Betaproteobacteria bacterium]
MPNQQPVLDAVFAALSDATRRALIERLAKGPAAVSELAEPFDMALPSLMQHLATLERGGLVASEKEGRVRTYRLTPQALKPAEQWLSRQRDRWNTRLDQLDSLLLSQRSKKP